jgi:hypothetical protein
MKLVIATPTVTRPHPAYLAALEASVPALDAAGYDHSAVNEIGSSYISYARANMLHKAMVAGADLVMFIDHDVSWKPDALIKVLQAEGDVTCGTYRYKLDVEEYMGAFFIDEAGKPVTRADGCVLAQMIPAGFLKVTRAAVEKFAAAYPELTYGAKDADKKHVDLFNHGAHGGIWWGEDFAFARRWRELGGQIWVVPDISIDHHSPERAYRGNFHRYLEHRVSPFFKPPPEPAQAENQEEQS